MKIVAVLAALVFIGLGAAGFAGMIAMPPMFAAVLAVSGVVFAIFGLSHRRGMVPPGSSGNDLRPWM